MGVHVGINERSVNSANAKTPMNMEEFKAWALRNLDADKDGKISRDELADIIRRRGEWFAGLKAWKGIRSADSNRNGVVDEIEIGNLAQFAQKHLGIMIIS